MFSELQASHHALTLSIPVHSALLDLHNSICELCLAVIAAAQTEETDAFILSAGSMPNDGMLDVMYAMDLTQEKVSSCWLAEHCSGRRRNAQQASSLLQALHTFIP